MHPALSVVLFTALSGLGYGLLFALGLHAAISPGAVVQPVALPALAVGFVLVTAGLLCSVAHLGQPTRAWRAFSQWRNSWLSREGVAAVVCYLPLMLLAVQAWHGDAGPASRALAGLLAIAAGVTVYCTARIYTSLATVPAWRHPLVLPGYLLFAATGGVAAYAALRAIVDAPAAPAGVLLAVLAIALGVLKHRYWQALPALHAPTTAASVGLPHRTVRTVEAPHTEANYLTREMGFVLARRHAGRLQRIALVLFAALPAVLGGVAWAAGGALPTTLALIAAVAATLLGSIVERWLFFAEARHVVMGYYS